MSLIQLYMELQQSGCLLENIGYKRPLSCRCSCEGLITIHHLTANTDNTVCEPFNRSFHKIQTNTRGNMCVEGGGRFLLILY